MAVLDEYVKYLVHFNGADESTTFANSVVGGDSVSVGGSAQVDTAWKQLGSGSLLLPDTTTDYLYFPNSDNCKFGSGDFTIEFFLRWNGDLSGYPRLGPSFWGAAGQRGWYIWLDYSGTKLYFTYSTNGTNEVNKYVSWSPIKNYTYHIEIGRSGSSLYFFVNGTQVGSTQSMGSDEIYSPDTQLLAFGVSGTAISTSYDEFCISKGICRHTTGFTPPTEEYGNIEVDPDDLAISTALSVAGLSFSPVVAPDALAASLALSIGEVFNGWKVDDAGPLAADLSLSASLKLEIAISEFAAATLLSGAPYYEITTSPGPLHAALALSITGVARFKGNEVSTTYLCYLTGSEDDLDDLLMPISSFQATLRETGESLLSVVVPGNDLAEGIANRPNGNIVVKMVKTYDTGNTITETICSVPFDHLRIDEGSTSISCTLSGYGTWGGSPKAVTLTGASYACTDDGNRRYRCKPDLFLRPGDTVTIDGVSYVAARITWAIGESNETMEVSEAA